MTKTNWIQAVKVSLPEHMHDLQNNLDSCMDTKYLSEQEAHSCALAAAITSGNGELAFEISMNSLLFGDPIREIVAQAVQFEAANGPWENFLRIMPGQFTKFLTYKTAYLNNPQYFHLYGFVVAIVNNDISGMQNYITLLKKDDFDNSKIAEVAFIASTVSSITKVII